jgi:putative membrane protein
MNCFRVIPVVIFLLFGTFFCGASIAGSVLTSQEFVDSAAIRSISEVETAKIALSESSAPDIRAYAQAMITEQQAMIDSLRAFANDQHLQMYSDAELQTKARTYIFQRNGESFDRSYVGMRALERKKAVSLFRTAAESADTTLRQYATTQLPALMRALYQTQTLVEQNHPPKVLAKIAHY